MPPFISVVIPALNEEKYLSKCLASFAQQTYKNFEIIVSDGDSADRTVQIARSYETKLVITPNSTVTLARQKGVEAAKGEIIVGADSDTIYPPTHLEKIAVFFQNHAQVVALGGGGIFEAKPRLLHFSWKIYYKLVGIIFFLTRFVLYLPAFNLSFRKSAFQKLGGYTTYLDYGGDEIDFLNKLRRIGKIHFDNTLDVYPSSRRAKEGLWKLIVKHTLIDYYLSLFLAKLFKRTVIRGKPVR